MTKLEILKKNLENMIDGLTKEQIIQAWNETEKNFDQASPVIRGAIMDRMEREDPEKFWEWVNSSDDPKIESFYK